MQDLKFKRDLFVNYSKAGIIERQGISDFPIGYSLDESVIDAALQLREKFDPTIEKSYYDQTDCKQDQIVDRKLLKRSLSGPLPLVATPHQTAWAFAMNNGKAALTATAPVTVGGKTLHEHLITRSKGSLPVVFPLVDFFQKIDDAEAIEGKLYKALASEGFTLTIDEDSAITVDLDVFGSANLADIAEDFEEKPCIAEPAMFHESVTLKINNENFTSNLVKLVFTDKPAIFKTDATSGAGKEVKRVITDKRVYTLSIQLDVGPSSSVYQRSLVEGKAPVVLTLGETDDEHLIFTFKKVQFETTSKVRDHIGEAGRRGYTFECSVQYDPADDETPVKLIAWLEQSLAFLRQNI